MTYPPTSLTLWWDTCTTLCTASCLQKGARMRPSEGNMTPSPRAPLMAMHLSVDCLTIGLTKMSLEEETPPRMEIFTGQNVQPIAPPEPLRTPAPWTRNKTESTCPKILMLGPWCKCRPRQKLSPTPTLVSKRQGKKSRHIMRRISAVESPPKSLQFVTRMAKQKSASDIHTR